MQELRKVSGVTPIRYDQSKDAFKVLKGGGSLLLSSIGYVIELHFNTGGGVGTEVLVHSSESGIGAEIAMCQRMEALGFHNRGVKRRSSWMQRCSRVTARMKSISGLRACRAR